MNEAIQQRLRQFIREQELSPGDRLPSENRLARSLGVGRNALREALRSLEALGIVEARVGSGWYVREMNLDIVADALLLSLELTPRTFDGLYRVRELLECTFIEDAVDVLTADDLASLRRIVDEMEGKAHAEDLVPLDHLFHKALYARLGNPVLDILVDLFFRVHPIEHRQYPRKNPEGITREHREILDAVSSGDAETARQIMRDAFQAYLSLAKGEDSA
jgi:DNA-binding FadR family transcriptional regulator